MSAGLTFTGVAPATISNLGPGFDILGCAVEGAVDCVTATLLEDARVVIAEPGASDLPTDATKHTAGIAALEVLRLARREDVGVRLSTRKGIPLYGGQGGSAASAVAAAVAVNGLIGSPLSEAALLAACLAAEERVSGKHGDNVAPALMGGLVLVRDLESLDIIRLPVPGELRVVVVHPHILIETKKARAVIPREFPTSTVVAHAADVAGLIAGLTLGDFDLIARSLTDRIAEPFRAVLIPGFADAKNAAKKTGALGASISGSGPTTFALARGDECAERVMRAMLRAYESAGVECDGRVARIRAGAYAVEGSVGLERE